MLFDIIQLILNNIILLTVIGIILTLGVIALELESIRHYKKLEEEEKEENGNDITT